MNRQEFLNQFNVLYNNETSNQAPDLNGYEISVFLTKAEYEVLKNYFSRTSNKSGVGFDDSPKRQIDFSTIIRDNVYTNISNNQILRDDTRKEVLCILSEEVIEEGEKCIVVPISYEEYNRIQSKPYKYPYKRQVWRLINSVTNADTLVITIIGHYNKSVSKYSIRYIKKPLPIIVEDETIWSNDTTNGLTIDGWPKLIESDSNPGSDEPEYELEYPEIELPEELHQEVLQRAVELAKIAWQGDLNATLTGGQRSE